MKSSALPLPLTLRGEADYQALSNIKEYISALHGDNSLTTPTVSVGEDFFKILKEIYESACEGTIPEIPCVYDGINILGYIPRKFLRKLGIRNTKSRFIQDFKRDEIFLILKQTFWYRKLKPRVKTQYWELINSKRINDLREIINSGTGIMISLFLSVPDYPWNYDFTDRIMVSVMSNLIMDSSFLPRWKKWKKRLRKQCLTNSYDGSYDNSWSWFSKLAPYFRDVNTRLGAFRVMTLTQTRNTGLPIGRTMVEKSIRKFCDTITEPCSMPDELPGRYLEQALAKFVREKTVKRAENIARESISTTSCFEVGRKEKGIDRNGQLAYLDAGKVSEAKAILQSGPAFRVDLETGTITQEEIPENNIGERLFHQCLAIFINGYDDIYSVKLDTIREPGPKVRTITASSFIHAELLQVWSHITLEILKSIPWCRSGISKSRHGWEMAESISPEDPSLGWLFDEGLEPLGLSTDLEEATDHFNWYVGRDLIRTLNSVLGIPTWYGRVVEDLLCNSRKVFYQGKLLCNTQRGCLMGDPGTKTLLTALGVSVIQKAYNANMNLFARIIGDDFAAISTSEETLTSILASYEYWDMKISQDDTYISNRYIFFTEELISIPRTVHDTIDRIKKSRRWGRSPYIDSVKIRLLLDVKKNRDDFSYTPIGRITQYGRDMSYLKEGADPAALFHLGSFIQDFCLDLSHRYKSFVYFPQYAIGEGKPVLFNHIPNVLSFWYNQYRKNLAGCYNQCVYHLVQFLRNNNEEYEDSAIRYASIGTFRHSENEAWKVHYKPLEDERFEKYEIGTIGRYRSVSKPIMNRLKTYIISETEIIGKLAKADHVRQLLFDEEPEYEEASLLDFDFTKAEKISEKDIKEFFNVWMKDPNQFHTVQMEHYFEREPVEEILGEDYPLQVNIQLSYKYSSWKSYQEREVSDRMEDHDEVALYEWFKKNRNVIPPEVEDIPRRSISDDEVLLDQKTFYNRFEHLFLITDDLKLAQKLSDYRSSQGNLKTYRIPVLHWLAAKCSWREFKCEVMDDLNTWVDLGSYEAKMAQLNINGVSNFTAFETLEVVPDIKPGEPYRPVRDYKGKLGDQKPLEIPLPNTPRRYRIGIANYMQREEKEYKALLDKLTPSS